MRIAFDAKRAVQNATGLGNYSRYVLEILCRYFTGNEYFLYAPHRRHNPQLDRLISEFPHISMRYPHGIWEKLPAAWRTWGITNDLTNDRIQIYHGLSNELPLSIAKAKSVKSVVTLHDIIFRRLPQCYHTADRWSYNYKYGNSCRNADAVIAVSERTKQDAIELWGIDERKIHVIYQNCDDSFREKCDEEKLREVKHSYNLPNRYILNVGSIEERKNILLAVKAMPKLPQGIDLVIVGKRTSYTDKVERFIKENRLENRVHILSAVPFTDLPAIYQSAEIFVYPSRYEGFGIPLIEALWSGIPGVAATGSCLEEAGGKGFIYVDPDSTDEMAESLLRLLGNPDMRNDLAKQGKNHLAKFSKEKQASQLIELYTTLLS